MKKRTIKGHLHLHRETIRVLTRVRGASQATLNGTAGCCEEHDFTYECQATLFTVDTSCEASMCGIECHTDVFC